MGLFGSHARVGASAAGSYEIKRSLRFNSGDSAKLERIPSSTGNQKVWTWSGWVKRTKLGHTDHIFGCDNDADGNNNGIAGLYFNSSDDKLHTYFDTSGTAPYGAINARVYRDTSSWYHIVWKVDAVNTETKVWVNGVEETVASGNMPPNYSYHMNESGFRMNMGVDGWDNSTYSNLYFAEVHYCDGQEYQASDFGETDADTGKWIPKEVTGLTYGTNGFYLNFSDNSNTTAATLGKDSSGNSNNFTPHNFSVSAGVGNDSVTDTPTNNYPTLNPLNGLSTGFYVPYNGALDYNITDTAYIGLSTMAVPTSGKWYAECTATDVESLGFGLRPSDWHGGLFDKGYLYLYYGKTWKDNAEQETVTAISDGDIVGCAVDRTAGTVQFSLNGTNKGSTLALVADEEYYFWVARGASSGGAPIGSVNFGQRAFSHQPSGFKGLCTSELPTPTIKKPTDYFNTVLYTGNGAVKTVTGVGFQTDLLINKRRDTANVNLVVDSVRGVGNGMSTGLLDGDYTSRVASFNADGFVSDNGSWGQINADGGTYVAWNWKESASAGLDIVTYTGNATGSGAEQTIAHNLGVVPEMIIVKARTVPYSGGGDWIVYHKDLSNPSQYFLKLNTSDNEITSSTDMWNQTAPTASNFSVGYEYQVNKDGVNHVAYVFAGVEGFSKIGKYVGNGSTTDGVFVYLGFKPALLLMKRLASENWVIVDNKRDPDNPIINYLIFNTDATAADGVAYDFLSNGVKFRGASQNENGASYVYIAFAERPFKYANAR